MCIPVDAREVDCYMGVIVVLVRVTFWRNTMDFVPENSVSLYIMNTKSVMYLNCVSRW